MNLHTLGMALGAIAAALAAFLAADPSIPEPYNQILAGLVAASSAASVYLQRYYAPSPPVQAPV